MKNFERFLFACIGFFFGYIALALFTDLRIDRLRPYLQQASIDAGRKACADEYEKRYMMNEAFLVMKRKKRDALLQKYAKQIEKVTEME